MAQNITLLGANYPDVPAVDLPKTGGGTARFSDASVTTAVEADVSAGKIFLKADGSIGTGTGSGGGGTGAVWQDQQGYINLDDEEGGSVTVEALSVTTNGTYTAPAGKAYSPVTVNVSGGGGGEEKKAVNFIDYDGTIVYSYTAQEANALNDLPANPSHTGLTAQGWNWTLAQIKSYLTDIPNGEIWIGQSYTTASGKTEIDIVLEDPAALSPYLALGYNGTVTIDWGDGTTSTASGSSYTTLIYTQHVYASTGEYTISITGNVGFRANSDSYGAVLLPRSSEGSYKVYSKTIQHIRLSATARFGNYGLAGCINLQTITIPTSITNVNQYMFINCYSLKAVTIPSGTLSLQSSAFRECYSLQTVSLPGGFTTLNTYAFYNCYELTNITLPTTMSTFGGYAFTGCKSLTNITIPGGTTSIGASAWASCESMTVYHFKATTPPSISTSTIYTIPTITVIYVPSESLTDYQTTSNWSNIASYIQGE